MCKVTFDRVEHQQWTGPMARRHVHRKSDVSHVTGACFNLCLLRSSRSGVSSIPSPHNSLLSSDSEP
jgi:hypothetical protein